MYGKLVNSGFTVAKRRGPSQQRKIIRGYLAIIHCGMGTRDRVMGKRRKCIRIYVAGNTVDAKQLRNQILGTFLVGILAQIKHNNPGYILPESNEKNTQLLKTYLTSISFPENVFPL